MGRLTLKDVEAIRHLVSGAQELLLHTPPAGPYVLITQLKWVAIRLASALVRTRGLEIDTTQNPDRDLQWKVATHVEADGMLPVGSVQELKALTELPERYDVVLSPASVARRLQWVRTLAISAVPVLDEAVPGVGDGLFEAAEAFRHAHVPAEHQETALRLWGAPTKGVMARWEAKLDMLGPFASMASLEEVLESAPGPGPTVEFLRGYLAGLQVAL